MRILWRSLLCLALLGLLAAVLQLDIPLIFPTYRTEFAGGIFFYLARYDLFDGLVLVGGALLCLLLIRGRTGTPTGEPVTLEKRSWISLVAVCVLLITYAGTKVVYHEYPFSMDEYIAEFQAKLFASGRVNLELPQNLRRESHLMAPIFMHQIMTHSEWLTPYLPVYSICRAVFAVVGQSWLTNPAMAWASVVLIAAAAGRIWPEEPHAPFIAALLLATSTEFLITSMSAYAMPGHLLFNLLWICLFLSGKRWEFALTPWVGVLAIGLHQPVPHLLFVFPFFVGLFLKKRWVTLGYFSIVYLAGLAVWHWYLDTHADMSYSHYFRFWTPLMCLRSGIVVFQLFTWQSVATGVLLCAAFAYRKMFSPFLWQCLGGLVLTFLFYSFFLLGQGHGWGARYMYSALGNLVLMATFGYLQLWRSGCREALQRVLLCSSLIAVFMQLPARSIEAERIIRPYREAYGDLESRHVPYVILYSKDAWYGGDLVRNGPDLDQEETHILRGEYMTRQQFEALEKSSKTVVVREPDLFKEGILPDVKP